ncbi:sensor histidine kinase [Thermophagus sp. OGC60D27]|uniref:sensor histidine kinase n=1 Tax=Thermophagus sp. OGC60D27 TaxID=3458415 RepID=UPI00403811DF
MLRSIVIIVLCFLIRPDVSSENSYSNQAKGCLLLEGTEEFIEAGVIPFGIAQHISPTNFFLIHRSSFGAGISLPSISFLTHGVNGSIWKKIVETYWFRLVLLPLMVSFGVLYVNRTSRIKKLNRLIAERTKEIRNQNKILAQKKNELTRVNLKLQEHQDKVESQATQLTYEITAKNKFISIIAHDLRGSFNAIMGFSELLLTSRDSLAPDEAESHLVQIYNSAEQAYNLLEDLLLWANSQSGKINPDFKAVSLATVCADVITLLKDLACQKNIKIQCLSGSDILVQADDFMLRTIFRNLLSNAIKFTPQGGNISIYSEKNQNDAIVTVSDTGIGIDQHLQEKLWEVFPNSLREGTAGEKGSGLGLPLCKEFIEKQNGQIWVESKPGVGSDFKFKLPLA